MLCHESDEGFHAPRLKSEKVEGAVQGGDMDAEAARGGAADAVDDEARRRDGAAVRLEVEQLRQRAANVDGEGARLGAQVDPPQDLQRRAHLDDVLLRRAAVAARAPARARAAGRHGDSLFLFGLFFCSDFVSCVCVCVLFSFFVLYCCVFCDRGSKNGAVAFFSLSARYATAGTRA